MFGADPTNGRVGATCYAMGVPYVAAPKVIAYILTRSPIRIHGVGACRRHASATPANQIHPGTTAK